MFDDGHISPGSYHVTHFATLQGSIVSGALDFIMTSLGLQPLDVYIQDLLNVSYP